jgi:hypothetical protein
MYFLEEAFFKLIFPYDHTLSCGGCHLCWLGGTGEFSKNVHIW